MMKCSKMKHTSVVRYGPDQGANFPFPNSLLVSIGFVARLSYYVVRFFETILLHLKYWITDSYNQCSKCSKIYYMFLKYLYLWLSVWLNI
jgi:hypothetical protein